MNNVISIIDLHNGHNNLSQVSVVYVCLLDTFHLPIIYVNMYLKLTNYLDTLLPNPDRNLNVHSVYSVFKTKSIERIVLFVRLIKHLVCFPFLCNFCIRFDSD